MGPKTWHHKDALKGLGGCYNANIEDSGPGWLFRKMKYQSVKLYVDKVNENDDTDTHSVASSYKSAVTNHSVMTDKEFERALMIEDLIHKTAVTTIVSKKYEGDSIMYKLIEGSVINVKIGEVSIAEWENGNTAIIKKGVFGAQDVDLLPFLGTIDEKQTTEGFTNVMENFICFIAMAMIKPTTYYTDGYCMYAYCDDESFERTLDFMNLEME